VGGFCDVFAAEHGGSLVAVKLSRAFAADALAARAAELVAHEAAVLRDLAPAADARHLPRLLVAVLTRQPPNARAFLVLQPLGEPLQQVRAAQGADAGGGAREERAARRRLDGLAHAVVTDVLAALRYAHVKGWVHADVRPSNVVRRADGAFVLVDWGVAMRAHTRCPELVGHQHFACDAALACAAGAAPDWVASPASDVECAAYLGAALVLGTSACQPPWAAAVLQCAAQLRTGEAAFDALRIERAEHMPTAPHTLTLLRERSLVAAAAEALARTRLEDLAAAVAAGAGVDVALSVDVTDSLYSLR
jgi:hypothetical protein